MKKIIAFIPARGGSKSIPKKNIKRLHGQPLIFWSIQELIKSSHVDEIWVSTDSLEIAELVENVDKKVKVHNRSAANASDQASTESVLLEFISDQNLDQDLIVLVQATSPFTKSEDFDQAIKLYIDGNSDSVLSVAESKRFFWNRNGQSINYDYKSRPRRQDFDPDYMENGAFYINSARNIVQNGNRLSGKIGLHVMPDYTGLEIDEELDWLLASYMMKHLEYNPELVIRQNIKLFVSDVDGVLTDAGMYYSEKGDELKKFNTRDGMGFELLRKSGIKTALVTSEQTKIVESRAKKLKIDYLYQGKQHGGKLDAVKEICEIEGISLNEVAYIGDDINCIEILKEAGWSACPSDAAAQIKNLTDIDVLKCSGGEGVVREFAEKILGLF